MTKELRSVGRSAYDSIAELVDSVYAATSDDARYVALEAVYSDPLSLDVWRSTYSGARYELLLSTGGPATRIVGELDEYDEPESARLEVQDWGTPWTRYHCDSSVLEQYACFFCYEGV